MPEWVKWFFDGLGTEIISLLIGIVSGGVIGFRIGKRKSKLIQVQKAGTGSEQYQKGMISTESASNYEEISDSISSFCQKQEAGNDSKQIQIGGQNNV